VNIQGYRVATVVLAAISRGWPHETSLPEDHDVVEVEHHIHVDVDEATDGADYEDRRKQQCETAVLAERHNFICSGVLDLERLSN